ncbi:mannitol dehydrogenase family protein [soil metagenome]
MVTPVGLRPEHLHDLDPRVAVPGYDRSAVTVGIVHLGVGAFHRAHQAMYIDRLLNQGLALDWGICGVGVLPGDSTMRDALQAQEGLYTLLIKHPNGSLEPRVIGSVVEYLLAPDDPEAVIERMAAEQTRIVSLTVNEGGYNIHPVTAEFDYRDAAMVDDASTGAVPTTAFGLITEALARRRERGIGAFTIMSCDNIQGNGDVARKMITAFARLRSPDLADWIEGNARFPNSMVDRITPVTTDADRELLAAKFGIADAWPVVCEPFTQWVVEDEFPLGRPPLEEAGVQVVHDVKPYELMKLRLLNVSHQALCYLGYLCGYRYAHEVCSNQVFIRFLRDFMDIESTPTLLPVPGVDLEQYKSTLIERFANPEVRDTLARLCAESSDRIPKWVLPVIREELARGGEIRRATLVVAAWARYAEGVDEDGNPITVVDRLSEQLTTAALEQREKPLAFIAHRDLFGSLIDEPRFVQTFRAALESLHSKGALATVSAEVDE